MHVRLSLIWLLCVLFGCAKAPETELTFLSVGQGDSAVFRTAGKTVIIDVGPVDGRQDAGERIIVPFLRRSGVRKIDLVLITHPDSDHIGGLRAIAERFDIAKLAIPATFRNHPDMIEGLERARIRFEHVDWLVGESAAKVGDFVIRTDSIPWAEGSSDNDGSLFVHLSNGTASATLSGDASESVELLMKGRGNWAAQLMNAGHHGSGSSSSYGWIRAVSPEVAVVSCGIENPYGHPAVDVLKRYKDLGVPVLRTDQLGHIRFKVTDRGFERVQ